MVKRFVKYREGSFRVESDIKARWLGPTDLKYIQSKANTFWRFIGEMLKGSKCLGLIKDGEVLSYLWVNDNLKYFGLDEKLKPNECYIYNANTKPDRRGKGYAQILRSKCYEMLKDKDTFYSISDLNNKPALKFKANIKAEVIESYLFIKFWKFKYLKKCKLPKTSFKSSGMTLKVK